LNSGSIPFPCNQFVIASLHSLNIRYYYIFQYMIIKFYSFDFKICKSRNKNDPRGILLIACFIELIDWSLNKSKLVKFHGFVIFKIIQRRHFRACDNHLFRMNFVKFHCRSCTSQIKNCEKTHFPHLFSTILFHSSISGFLPIDKNLMIVWIFYRTFQ